jgi:hypothetical protein
MTIKHPYEFINKDNFEIIKTALNVGLRANKTPQEIATLMVRSTNLEYDICLGIVQEELLSTMQALQDKEENV